MKNIVFSNLFIRGLPWYWSVEKKKKNYTKWNGNSVLLPLTV